MLYCLIQESNLYVWKFNYAQYTSCAHTLNRFHSISNTDRKGKHLTVIPIDMESKHNEAALCLAIAPDNSRLYSGGLDGNILVHDIQTWVLIESILALVLFFIDYFFTLL